MYGMYQPIILGSSTECKCDILGTNGTLKYCDRQTGQCPCLSNVMGLDCDQCTENHWKIASGEGCEHCACDEIGAESEQCNSVSDTLRVVVLGIYWAFIANTLVQFLF